MRTPSLPFTDCGLPRTLRVTLHTHALRFIPCSPRLRLCRFWFTYTLPHTWILVLVIHRCLRGYTLPVGWFYRLPVTFAVTRLCYRFTPRTFCRFTPTVATHIHTVSSATLHIPHVLPTTPLYLAVLRFYGCLAHHILPLPRLYGSFGWFVYTRFACTFVGCCRTAVRICRTHCRIAFVWLPRTLTRLLCVCPCCWTFRSRRLTGGAVLLGLPFAVRRRFAM